MNLLPPPPTEETRRIPVVPVHENVPESTGAGYRPAFFVAIVALLALIAHDVFWPFQGDILERYLPATNIAASAPAPVVIEKPEKATSVDVRVPETVRRGERILAKLSLENPLSSPATVTISPILNHAFSNFPANQVVTIQAHARFELQTPLVAEVSGSWFVGWKLQSNDLAVPETVEGAVVVLDPALNVSIDAGDARTLQVAKSGWIPVTIWYENTSAVRIQPTIVLRNDFETRTIHLRALAPHGKGSLRTRIRSAVAVRGTSADLHALGLRADVSYRVADMPPVAYTVAPHPDALAANVFARLFDSRGKRLSTSATPFVPGTPVKLWINIRIPRETRAFTKFIVTATPADGVTLTGKTWGNPRDRLTVTKGGSLAWETSPMPKKSFLEPLAGFEIEFTPKEGDTGTFPKILSTLTVDGVPNFFLTTQHLDLGAVSGNLVNDRFAKDPGIVRK